MVPREWMSLRAMSDIEGSPKNLDIDAYHAVGLMMPVLM